MSNWGLALINQSLVGILANWAFYRAATALVLGSSSSIEHLPNLLHVRIFSYILLSGLTFSVRGAHFQLTHETNLSIQLDLPDLRAQSSSGQWRRCHRRWRSPEERRAQRMCKSSFPFPCRRTQPADADDPNARFNFVAPKATTKY